MATATQTRPTKQPTPKQIHRLADRYVPRFTQTYLAEVERLRNQITPELMERAMREGLTGDPYSLLDLVDAMAIAKEASPIDHYPVYTELLASAAKLAGVNLSIDSPFVLEAAKKLTANLVTNVRASTKKAIRQIIFEAVRDGDAPAVAQKAIREIVGLTQQDAMRIKRLQKAGAPPERVARTRAKYLRRRALNIARSETMFASNRGQQLAWREMVRDNLIDTSGFAQEWITTPDDRLCDLCSPMDGQSIDLGSSFESSERGVLPSARVPYAGVSVESPPLHPGCRCTLGASFGDDE